MDTYVGFKKLVSAEDEAFLDRSRQELRAKAGQNNPPLTVIGIDCTPGVDLTELPTDKQIRRLAKSLGIFVVSLSSANLYVQHQNNSERSEVDSRKISEAEAIEAFSSLCPKPPYGFKEFEECLTYIVFVVTSIFRAAAVKEYCLNHSIVV